LDSAKNFKPKTILLWRKVAEHPEAQRIINLFPSAQVKIIEQQRYSYAKSMSPGKALLEGKRTLMIGQTQSFVNYFDGHLGTTVRCCPYYKLVPTSNGCPYFCTYCYLAFVYRKYSSFIKININYETMFKQIRKALRESTEKLSFNMGEMLDSLALDHITGFTKMLVPFFSDLSRGYLMLLTKSSNIDNLLAIEPNGHTVVSWSLNSRYAAKEYESGTATPDERIAAAKCCQEYGYHIRFRIDPGILHHNWRQEYSHLVQKIFSETNPENITLGMLRLLPGHPQLAKDAYGNRASRLCKNEFSEQGTDFKVRYKPESRIKFYKFLIDNIRSRNKKVPISLCRETPQVWQVLKNNCEFGKCNCLIC
jgi:spore photoproduct lyase